MKLKLITAAVCAALAASVMAGTASAKMFKGTVVHTNKRAHSFVIARSHGHMTEVHARHLPKVGSKVKVKVRRLRNGTFGSRHIRVVGHQRRIKVHGVVTYVDPARHSFVVSFRGGSIVVHRRVHKRLHAVLSAHTMLAHTTTTTLPSTGTVVTIDGSVDTEGTIQASGVTDNSQATGNIQLEGRVLAIDITQSTLTISADDSSDIPGASILLHMPAPTFSVANYQLGDMLQIVATLNTDGSYTAVGTSQDASQSQANGSSDQQGQDGGDSNSNDSSSSSSSSSDSQSSSGTSGTSTDQQSSSSTDN